MNDFDYDVLQKKITARSARNVKRGSRSKKVTLPSDRLTPAEWKRRNGPVENFNLNRPLTWELFNHMPTDLQAQYITRLREKYRVSQRALAEMLGVSNFTVVKKCQELNVKCSGEDRHRMTQEDRNRWDLFVSGNSLPETENTTQAHNAAIPPATTDEEPITATTLKNAVMQSGCITFTGSAGDAMRKVYGLLGESMVRLTVTWETEDSHG